MGAQPGPDGQELRARHYLRRLGARPLGHQEPPMPHDDRRPITPTRVIPAGAPLPARPPLPGEAPPWRTPPPPPPAVTAPVPVPPDPAPRIVEVRHVHEVILTSRDPDPEPSRWERLTAWLGRYVRPWQAVIGLTAAAVPIPGVGYSAASIWHYTVGLGREEWGIGWGYGLGLTPLALATTVLVRKGGSPLRLFALATTFVGSLAAFSWYDPVQFLTGVAR
ncbi:hypothetical protein ACFY78_18685 [Streptomyces olindensis]|uniref:hypothetical protein n=1 Tax=Streptomyces olindensis TaxID=358823 RepID=UPI0036AF8583